MAQQTIHKTKIPRTNWSGATGPAAGRVSLPNFMANNITLLPATLEDEEYYTAVSKLAVGRTRAAGKPVRGAA